MRQIHARFLGLAASIVITLPTWAAVTGTPRDASLKKGEIETTVLRDGPIEAGIEQTDHSNDLLNRFDNMYQSALDNDSQAKKLNKAVKHYRAPAQRAKVRLQDGLNVLVPYKGSTLSTEAGDVITEEKAKLNGRSAAEYQQQVLHDNKHLQLTKSVMQVVSGLGDSDKERGATTIAKGMSKLTEVLGEEKAKETLAGLQKWQEDVFVPESVMTQEILGPEDQGSRHESALSGALEADAVSQKVLKEIHRYSHQGVVRRTTGRVVETALGVAALAPSVVGPAAALGITMFEVANGGSEEHKLLNELYLSKRLESRKRVLSEELFLILTNYDLALAKHNSLMVAYSELLINELCGVDTAKKILGHGTGTGTVASEKEDTVSDNETDRPVAPEKEKIVSDSGKESPAASDKEKSVGDNDKHSKAAPKRKKIVSGSHKNSSAASDRKKFVSDSDQVPSIAVDRNQLVTGGGNDTPVATEQEKFVSDSDKDSPAAY